MLKKLMLARGENAFESCGVRRQLGFYGPAPSTMK
jgi:hypothetical protein